MSIFSKLFGKFHRRKHRKRRLQEREESQSYYQSLEQIDPDDDDGFDFDELDFKPTKLKDIGSIRAYVINLCEQMIDISKEMDDVRQEYKRLTAQLNDIQVFEELKGEQKKQLDEVATNLANLMKMRTDCLNAEQKLSDEMFRMLEEFEDEMPSIIHRLKDNENYLDAIRRDLNRLAAEKIEWSVLRHEKQEEKERLQKISGIVVTSFGVLAVVVAVLSIFLEWEMFPLLLLALIATVIIVVLVIRMQDCEKDIQRSNVNQNYVISLENRVKIKYVNMRNAVDYTCHRFDVITSRELTNRYEEYIDICRGREKVRQVNQDLEYYNDKLYRVLKNMKLSDVRFWMNNAYAIINPKEMVEVKHELFENRKKLRSQIEYNLKAIDEIRDEVNMYCDIMGEKSPQVRAIMYKVEEVNRGII